MEEKTSKKPSKSVAISARCKRIYCTQNAHVEYEKTCIVCGKKFTAKSDKAKVCSEKCQYQVKKARKKAAEATAQAIGQLTPAQKKAIERAGGIKNIAQMPIGQFTKGQKALAWMSLGLVTWLIVDEMQRKERDYKRKWGARAQA